MSPFFSAQIAVVSRTSRCYAALASVDGLRVSRLSGFQGIKRQLSSITEKVDNRSQMASGFFVRCVLMRSRLPERASGAFEIFVLCIQRNPIDLSQNRRKKRP